MLAPVDITIRTYIALAGSVFFLLTARYLNHGTYSLPKLKFRI